MYCEGGFRGGAIDVAQVTHGQALESDLRPLRRARRRPRRDPRAVQAPAAFPAGRRGRSRSRRRAAARSMATPTAPRCLRHARSDQLDRPRPGVRDRGRGRRPPAPLRHRRRRRVRRARRRDRPRGVACAASPSTSPTRKVSLYPPLLSEGAASLLPDGPRPAILFTVRVDPDRKLRARSVPNARSSTAAPSSAMPASREPIFRPPFSSSRDASQAAEAARGAARVDPPQQQVVALPGGRLRARFRPDVGDRAGQCRAVAGRQPRRRRRAAGRRRPACSGSWPSRASGRSRGFATPPRRSGVDWPTNQSLEQREPALDPNDRKRRRLHARHPPRRVGRALCRVR